MTKIWGLNKITGLWLFMRDVKISEADIWLKIFRDCEYEKYSEFKASKNRPKYESGSHLHKTT